MADRLTAADDLKVLRRRCAALEVVLEEKRRHIDTLLREQWRLERVIKDRTDELNYFKEWPYE